MSEKSSQTPFFGSFVCWGWFYKDPPLSIFSLENLENVFSKLSILALISLAADRKPPDLCQKTHLSQNFESVDGKF